MKLILVISLLALTAAVVAAQEGQPATDNNLLKNGKFEGKQLPAGWKPPQDWMLARFRMQQQSGESFVRVKEAQAVLTTTFDLPEDAGAIQYSAKARLQDFIPGKQAWDIPTVDLQILDAAGQPLIAKTWPTALKFRSDTDWTTESSQVSVPEGGVKGQITISFRGKGTFDVAEVKAMAAESADGAAEKGGGKQKAVLPPAGKEAGLLPQTSFTGKGVPTGWQPGEPWMAAAFSVSGNGFLKMDKLKGRDGYYIETTGPIDPAATPKVRMHTRMQGRPHRMERTEDVKQRPRVELIFEDAAGKPVGEALIIPITGFITAQATQSIIGDVPPQAARMRSRIVYHGREGWLELRNFRVERATGKEPAWMHEPAPVPAGAMFAHPIGNEGINVMPPKEQLEREPGASVDESKVTQTIRVTPADDLHAAFTKARSLLDQGQGVKLVLAAGTYRLDRPLKLDNLNDAAKEAVFVLEGEAAGEVIISGSNQETFAPAGWKLVDAQRRIYRHDWQHNWGFVSEGYYQPAHVLSHRREMLFLNGRPMTQEIIEGTTFVDRQGRVYNSVGLVVEEKSGSKGGYTYTGFRGLDVLDAGEFAVAELGPGDKDYDDHAYPNSLLLRLPEDMSTLEGATVEVAITPELFDAQNKSNLVLRNLVFRHAASWWNNNRETTAVQVEGNYDFGVHDVLIENCRMEHNNGKGLSIGKLRSGELRNVTVAENGNFGMGFHHLYNMVCRNLDVLNNNWRGRISESTIHSTGGMTWSGERMRFYNCRFNGNYGSGWRSDVWVIDVIAEDCQFNNNDTHGVFHELAWGPVVHRRCEMSGNENGAQLTNNQGLTFEDCRMLDNRNLGILFYAMPGRISPPSILSRGKQFLELNKQIVLRNSTIAATGAESGLIGQRFGQGSAENYQQTIRNEYTGEYNRFWHPTRTETFETTSDYKDRTWTDLAGWRQITGDDLNSQWKAPEGAREK